MTDDSDNLQVLVSVPTEAEAELIVGVLAGEGIGATAAGGFVSGFKAEAPGEVKVLVKNSDAARAQAVLDDVRAAYAADEPALGQVAESDPVERAGDGAVCPRCGSSEVDHITDKGVLAFLLTGFPFFQIRRRSECDDCGHTWK